MKTLKSNRREFARVGVHLRVRFRIVRGEDLEATRARILDAPSVWAPEGENELIRLGAGAGNGAEGTLARALLDVSRQIGRLTHQTFAEGGPTAVGEFVQLSGGGAMLATRVALLEGSRLDLRLADEDIECPPIRLIAEVLRTPHALEGRFPISFRGIHPSDQDRMIRFVHLLQRRELRKSRDT